MRRKTLCAGLAGIAVAAQLSQAAGAVTIAPHRAVYSMALARGGNSAVSDVNGTMLFEWADACDGWTVSQRSRMVFLYNTGVAVEISYDLTSWESKDGLRYRFFIRKTEDGELANEVRGDARIDAPGGAGVASYTLPEEKTVALPPGTLFPTAHSLRLIERAEAGDALLYAAVFDGSDEDGLFDVSAAIGIRAAPAPGGAAPLLGAGPSWPIALAFYLSGKQSATPEHEQFIRLHSNGVVDELLIDYGEFTVDATLKQVEQLPPPPC